MAKAKADGNGRLEEALALMVKGHSTLAQAQDSERFARIESILLEHSRIL